MAYQRSQIQYQPQGLSGQCNPNTRSFGVSKTNACMKMSETHDEELEMPARTPFESGKVTSSRPHRAISRYYGGKTIHLFGRIDVL